MRRSFLMFAIAVVVLVSMGLARQAAGPYKVTKTARVGGTGNFDYVYADVDGRRPEGEASNLLAKYWLTTTARTRAR